MNSFGFALFLAAVVILRAALPARLVWPLIAVSSLTFVALAEPAVLAVLIAAVLVAYCAGIALGRMDSGASRRFVRDASLLLILGPLVLTRLFDAGPIASLGVAFYTLRLVSYVAEVYSRRMEPERTLGVLWAYGAFFPEFLAGPIDRPAALMRQLRHPGSTDSASMVRGMQRFTWGLVQKYVVADQIGLFVDPVFADPTAWTGISLTFSIVLFAFQLLYDFAGYSDMAIGVGEMLGFRLTPNFDHPYCAHSVPEFWRRWHMSLSTWLRDYVFLPIAYPFSRGLEAAGIPVRTRTREMTVYAGATAATMTVAGVWHGTGWTFLVWGLIVGLYMTLSRLTQFWRDRSIRALGLARFPRMLGAVRIIFVFLLMSVAWVFFRASSLDDATYILTNASDGVLDWILAYLHSPTAILARGTCRIAPLLVGNKPVDLALVVVGIAWVEGVRWLQRRRELWHEFMRLPGHWRWAAYYATVLLLLAFGHFGQSQFIYAQF